MANLPTNYLDDILAESMNGKRKFRITYPNGLFEEVTIEDVSEYEQIGSNFGAGDINKTNQAVNEKFDSEDVVDPMLTTESGFAADAKITGEHLRMQKENLTASNGVCFKFGVNESGEYGYIVTDSEGADTFYPFKDLVRDTPATATAGKIAKGETAWVNGELITGTAIIVDPSAGYVILNSSNVNTGKELTGGWNPSGEFGISYGNKLSTVSTINRIDLSNISKIVFKYQFSDLASYNNAEYITEIPYFKYYLTDINGNNVKTKTIYAKDKKAGTFEDTMDVSGLSGTYNINYVLNSYWKEVDAGDYEKTYGAATRIKTIILY